MVKAWLVLSSLASSFLFFYKVKHYAAFSVPACSVCHCFQTDWDELESLLGPELCLIETQEQGAESWDVWAKCFITGCFLQTNEHVSVNRFPTITRAGQLKRRTTLSCVRFSIHAEASAHSYSMSVSLRLPKRSGRTSIQHHPFISVGEVTWGIPTRQDENNTVN